MSYLKEKKITLGGREKVRDGKNKQNVCSLPETNVCAGKDQRLEAGGWRLRLEAGGWRLSLEASAHTSSEEI